MLSSLVLSAMLLLLLVGSSVMVLVTTGTDVSTEDDQLSPFVRQYEKLSSDDFRIDYDRQSQITTVNFTAFGRHFRAVLQPDRSLFAKNATLAFVSSDGQVARNTLNEVGAFLLGYLDNEPNTSTVFGTVHHGFLDGSIRTRDNEYFLEAADKFFSSPDDRRRFIAVIYRASDVIMWPEHKHNFDVDHKHNFDADHKHNFDVDHKHNFDADHKHNFDIDHKHDFDVKHDGNSSANAVDNETRVSPANRQRRALDQMSDDLPPLPELAELRRVVGEKIRGRFIDDNDDYDDISDSLPGRIRDLFPSLINQTDFDSISDSINQSTSDSSSATTAEETFDSIDNFTAESLTNSTTSESSSETFNFSTTELTPIMKNSSSTDLTRKNVTAESTSKSTFETTTKSTFKSTQKTTFTTTQKLIPRSTFESTSTTNNSSKTVSTVGTSGRYTSNTLRNDFKFAGTDSDFNRKLNQRQARTSVYLFDKKHAKNATSDGDNSKGNEFVAKMMDPKSHGRTNDHCGPALTNVTRCTRSPSSATNISERDASFILFSSFLIFLIWLE